jgi:hypothetical protein
MRLRRRLEQVERVMGDRAGVMAVLWLGKDDAGLRARVEEGRRLGCQIRVVEFGVSDQADTMEEAEATVAKHREAADPMPITVYRRGTRGTEVLTEWDPGLPEWLRDPEDDAEEERTIAIV